MTDEGGGTGTCGAGVARVREGTTHADTADRPLGPTGTTAGRGHSRETTRGLAAGRRCGSPKLAPARHVESGVGPRVGCSPKPKPEPQKRNLQQHNLIWVIFGMQNLAPPPPSSVLMHPFGGGGLIEERPVEVCCRAASRILGYLTILSWATEQVLWVDCDHWARACHCHGRCLSRTRSTRGSGVLDPPVRCGASHEGLAGLFYKGVGGLKSKGLCTKNSLPGTKFDFPP